MTYDVKQHTRIPNVYDAWSGMNYAARVVRMDINTAWSSLLSATGCLLRRSTVRDHVWTRRTATGGLPEVKARMEYVEHKDEAHV